MSDSKERSSGDVPRNESSAPMLPTVNPQTEKTEPAPSSLHPAFYITYGPSEETHYPRSCEKQR